MLDIKWIRENPEALTTALRNRNWAADKAKAEAVLKDAADKLLANTVIENYRVELLS